MYLYGVFAGTKWGMTTNRKMAIKSAQTARGYITRMKYPVGNGSNVWDAPTFKMCSDLLADYRDYGTVPNLDAMSADDLMSFWATHQRGCNRAALGLSGPNSVNTTGDLACYASNKATAISCRLRGDINAATMYEGIADRIYQRLPAAARW